MGDININVNLWGNYPPLSKKNEKFLNSKNIHTTGNNVNEEYAQISNTINNESLMSIIMGEIQNLFSTLGSLFGNSSAASSPSSTDSAADFIAPSSPVDSAADFIAPSSPVDSVADTAQPADSDMNNEEPVAREEEPRTSNQLYYENSQGQRVDFKFDAEEYKRLCEKYNADDISTPQNDEERKFLAMNAFVRASAE